MRAMALTILRWGFWRQGKPGLRHMTRLFPFACTSSPGGAALMRIARTIQCPNARCRLLAARLSATPTHSMQGLRRRRDAVERLPGQHQFEPSRRKNTDIGVNNIQYTARFGVSGSMTRPWKSHRPSTI